MFFNMFEFNETLIELLNGTEVEVKPVVSLVDIATSPKILSAFASATRFHVWDYVAIGVYFVLLVLIGIWVRLQCNLHKCLFV